MSNAWITKRPGKRGVRYLVRWIEPMTGKCPGKTFKRSEDARAFRDQLRREIDNGEYFVMPKISFKDWKTQHLENMANSPDVDVSPKTILGHKEALEALESVCNPKTPNEVTPAMIRAFRKSQLEAGYKPRTINKRIEGIRSALSYAVRDEIIPENKLLGPHRLFLRVDQKTVRTLEVGEVLALMNATNDLQQKTLISFAYYCGMRRGEIAWIMWDDVDFDNMLVKIVSRDTHRTKTRQSRTIALRQETAELLKKLAQDRLSPYIFTNPGTFYHACGKLFQQIVKKAGIEECTLQNIRATCNTTLQDHGVSREAAMQVLGHSTPNVNLKHYTGTLKKQQRIVVNSLPSIG